MKYCHSCGNPNEDAARFCEKCGTPLQTANQAPSVSVPKTNLPSLDAATGALKTLDRKYLFGAISIVVLLIAGFVFFRPMSVATYDDKADQNVQLIMDGEQDVNLALNDYRSYANDYSASEHIDSADWKATCEDVDKGLAKIRKGARGIARLRPPKEYKSADERLNRWAKFMSAEWAKAIGSKVKEINPGDTYEQADRTLSRGDQSVSSGLSRAWSQLQRAAEDVSLNIEGE